MTIIGIGAGGHSKVLVDSLLLMGKKMDFLLDQDSSKHGQNVLGVEIKGGDSLLESYASENVQLVNCVGSTNQPALREKIFKKYKEAGYNFLSIIHPSATVSQFAELGEGVQIMAGATVMASVKVSDNVIINTQASVDHDSEIGEHSHIAPGVVLSGFVKIGKSCHVGTAASFIQSMSLGDGSVVGAGSVVNKNIPEGVTAYGVPARWDNV